MFSPVSARSASAYKRASVEASVEMADPHQLVNLLFEALLRSIGSAKLAVMSGDVPAKCKHIGDAIRILEEGLKAPLDIEKGGELASNLDSLYAYCAARLVFANLKSDSAVLDEVAALVAQVASGWRQINGRGPAYLQPV
ncbi:MAG: flagellar export chaperone FliS [Burkholderiales bacterium PBB4]|nr:MAG: flagellar export chaperone FliS [Burkholderiales bacterium PBB4]